MPQFTPTKAPSAAETSHVMIIRRRVQDLEQLMSPEPDCSYCGEDGHFAHACPQRPYDRA